MRRNRERLLRELYSAPRNPEIDARKEKFEQLNQIIRASHGFVTSIPGGRRSALRCAARLDLAG
jgi:hypothetical protein